MEPHQYSVGTYYRPGGSIDLLAGDRWDSDVLLHEYGHFVMYKIYGDDMPPSPNCSNHYWGGHSSLGCAWTEGWANFLQAAIQNDPNYVDTEDQTLHINFEPPIPSEVMLKMKAPLPLRCGTYLTRRRPPRAGILLAMALMALLTMGSG